MGGNGSITEDYVSTIFNDLFKYTKFHFQNEEWVMRYSKFSNLGKHLDAHMNIIETLNTIRRNACSLQEVIKAIEYFMHVWAEHILVMDKELGVYLNKKS
jgi:hemerythrin-like metal-binding protein